MIGVTDIITILGKRGSGKSTLGKYIQRVFPRVVVFDRLHEYSGDKSAIYVSTWEEFSEAIRATAAAARFKIVYQFDIEATNDDAVFNEAMRILYYRGSICVVIEEVHVFASAHYLPQWLREALLTGRHRKMALIATSQRPAELHKTLLSQSHHIFSGTLHEKNDVNYLASVMGEAAFSLSQLKPFHFLHFRPGEKTQVIRSKIR